MKAESMDLEGLHFEMTCSATPEQYDIFDRDGSQVGYLRMRHGNFSVSCPNVDGIEVIDRMVNGYGCFEDSEREACLIEAAKAIREWQRMA